MPNHDTGHGVVCYCYMPVGKCHEHEYKPRVHMEMGDTGQINRHCICSCFFRTRPSPLYNFRTSREEGDLKKLRRWDSKSIKQFGDVMP